MSKRLPVAPQGCPTSATEPPRSVPGASQHVSGGSRERPERLLDALQSVPGSSREPLEWPETISGPFWSHFGRKMHHFGWYFVTNFKGLGVFFLLQKARNSTSICNLLALPVQTFDATGQCNTPTTSPTRACQHSRCLPPSPT